MTSAASGSQDLMSPDLGGDDDDDYLVLDTNICGKGQDANSYR